MDLVLDDIKHQTIDLRHPDVVHDRSSPRIEKGYHVEAFDNSQLLHSVEQGVPLKHVDTADIADRSTPVIDPGVHVTKSNKAELLTEIQAKGAHSAAVHELKQKFLEEAREGGLPLHHVEHVHDTSGPKIPADVHLSKSPMPELLAEIRDPFKFLNHVEQVADRSSPVIDASVKVHIGNEHGELMRSIHEGGASGFPLRHVEPAQ